MTARSLLGNLLDRTYASAIGRFPSRTVRHAFLWLWLGGFGPGAAVQSGCRFLNGRKVFLGARNVINFGTLLDGRKHAIRIGDDVSIGPEATLLTLGHDPQSPDFADRGGEIVIGARAWIAYRAIVLPSVTIGEGAVVGAGAVVTRDVEPYAIVAGNPARKIGDRPRDLRYELNFSPFLG